MVSGRVVCACGWGDRQRKKKLVTLYSPGICGVRADTLRAWSTAATVSVAGVLVVAINAARVREKKENLAASVDTWGDKR